MTAHPEPRPARFGFAIVAGIGLIAAGVILALQNAGFAVPLSFRHLWPLLLVLLGLAKVVQCPLQRGGHFLVFLGLFFLGLQFQPVKTFRYGPPLGLLWLGVIITLKALRPSTRATSESAGRPASD